MPELPEVQTVVSQLGEKVVGKTMAGFWSDWKKKVLPSYAVFVKQVKGATILGTRRFGKHIVIDLDNEYSIIIHLKMTGHLLVKNERNRNTAVFTEDPVNGYIHHIFTLSDGVTIEFSDMRKFGWLHVMKTTEVEKLKSIATLGVDALSPQLDQAALTVLLEKKKKLLVSVALLDQNLIAGIGNIYRSEALFLAGIMPLRRIDTLSKRERVKLLQSIKIVLRKAAKLGGTSDGDFRDTDGLPGRFQRTLYVYNREKEACKKCDTIVERKKIGQRSVFYCPRCQK